MKRPAALLIPTAAAAAALAVVAAGGSSAQAPGERTLHFYEDATHETTKLIDHAPKSPSPNPGSSRFRLSVGDQLVGTTPVFDRKGGSRIGTLYGYGTVVKGNRFSNAAAIGQFVFELKDGTLVTAGVLRDKRTQTFSVIGGTRAYEGARGSQTEIDQGDGGLETVHLLP